MEPTPDSIPASPPPSFRSRTSSPASRNFLASEDPVTSDADRTLADTFDDGEDSDAEGNNGGDDRQRLMHNTPCTPAAEQRIENDGTRPGLSQGIAADPPSSTPAAQGHPNVTSATSQLSSANDGVFANLNAKPERGEKTEEQPPVCPSIVPSAPYRPTNKAPRPTNKPPRMPPHHTGKPRSLRPACPQTRFTLMVSQWARFFPLFGTE